MKIYNILLFFIHLSRGDDEIDCYVSPSCTATEFYDEATGFTDDTGFSAPGSNECCQVSVFIQSYM